MKQIDQYIYEFIANPTELSDQDMKAVMKRAGLTEVEQRVVIREVRAARCFGESALCEVTA